MLQVHEPITTSQNPCSTPIQDSLSNLLVDQSTKNQKIRKDIVES